ncbi:MULTISPECIES: endolytic transglycosylase MltG [Streptomyces]|uniref:endolytic transglycosylase MltG n=1 Tax=Streptomyces TaxID=1883 RepID=UPI0013177BA2|nr:MULTISPECIES: endolytic transglycosylase MltG [Streptomyces]QGZ47764.1 endolytic transglycosylase MltG [Streptomyces sp. QHH-9511]GGT94336.1 aminodeoxychorismate lyase [Streptomyces lateritius]
MTYRTWQPEHRRRPRLTRRGRIALLLGMVLAVAAATAVTVSLLLRDEPAVEKPRMLVIPEGWRAGQVYAAVDRSLGLPAGTTRAAAGAPATALALPAEAAGNPEGYLFPATYPVLSSTTPESLLRYMVDTAGKRFGAGHIGAGNQRKGLTLHQTVVVASIVQAEADTPEDMGKVARVVHNRLARGMALQMDSTINYALARSTVDTTHEDTRIDSPYNTYERTGLPPTPIGNPGEEAMTAAVQPPEGEWLYFVTVRPGDTRFTADYAEHQANVSEFNAERRAAKAG